MILADPRGRATATRIGGRITLDELLRRAALRRPDALAVLDPPNREAVVGGKPRSLTYKQAEHVVSAIAGRLRRMGLHTDGIVALQMANTVESLLTLLGVLRAGLIAMPLPALWRRSEMVAALSRVSPTALIVSGRMGTTDHYALAMQVAAEIFPIRYVCGYSAGAPDGLVPFDNLFDMGKLDPIPAWGEERAGDALLERYEPLCANVPPTRKKPHSQAFRDCTRGEVGSEAIRGSRPQDGMLRSPKKPEETC